MKIFCVLGAGTMGAGIAQWLLSNKSTVYLVDSNDNVLSTAVSNIEKSYDNLIKKNKFTEEAVRGFLSSLHTSNSITDVPKNIDLLIEAIVENLEIKQNVFSKLDKHFNNQTVFASNTSSLSISRIFSHLHERRCCGLHFFNPAPIMKLVEVVKSPYIKSEDLEGLRNILQKFKKVPAIVEDRPGFICNRVARNFYGESFRILSDDIPEQMQEIDFVLKNVAGFKMGPFELIDLIGVDINLNATKGVHSAFGSHPRFAPHQFQEKAVFEGRLGRKSNNHGLIIGRNKNKDFTLPRFNPEFSGKVDIEIYDELSNDFPENTFVFDKTKFNLEEKIELLKILKERNNDVVIEASHLSNEILHYAKEMSFDICNSVFVTEEKKCVEYISYSGNNSLPQAFSNFLQKDVIVRKNCDLGLIAPRVLMQIAFEATTALEEGLASQEDIDSAMRYGLNYPKGPFQWISSIGRETIEALRLNLCNTISRKPK